jgi:O-antigen/teichoic acid export membrane protein
MAALNTIAGSLAVNLIGVSGVAVAGLLSMLFMARWMPAAEFGQFSLILLAFNAIAAFDGVRPVMVFLGAQGANLGPRVRAGGAVAAATGVAVGIATFLLGRTILSEQLDTAESALLAIGLALYFPMSCFWGALDSQKETAFTGGLRSAAWICAYGACLAGAALGGRLLWYLSVFSAMNVALLAAYAARFYRCYATRNAKGEPGLGNTIVRAAWNTVLFNFGALVLASVDRLVLGWSAGAMQLGLYSAVYELATKPAALLRVIATIFYPEAARLQTNIATLARHWLRGIRIGFSVVYGAVCVVVFFRAQLTELLLGERFASAADPFGLLALGFVLVMIGYFCGIALNALGDFESSRKTYSTAALAMLVAAWPMVATWDMLGAAALYLAARSVDLAVLWITLRKLGQAFSANRTVVVAILFIMTAAFAWTAWTIPAIVSLVALLVAIEAHTECQELLRAVRDRTM